MMMEDAAADSNVSARRRVRPAQKLYVPPAQRTRRIRDPNERNNTENTVKYDENATIKVNENTSVKNHENATVKNPDNSTVRNNENATIKNNENTTIRNHENTTVKNNDNTTIRNLENTTVKNNENTTVKNTENSPIKNDKAPVERESPAMERTPKTTETPKIIDLITKTEEVSVITINCDRTGPDRNESEETVRPIRTNVNKKPKPLIKQVNKNDVLRIDTKNNTNKSIKKSPVKLMQVANWEDLFLEDDDDQEDSYDDQPGYRDDNGAKSDYSDTDDPGVNSKADQELEHVIEVYDFPSTFKTQDIMQIYNHINKESIYIKWCDETHALLVLGSAIQAQQALTLKHDIIKSRPMTMAGSAAKEVAAKCDLKPAMKRPQTSMHTARRMITTGLGIKTQISKEVQQKEREALRLAKELKKIQKQNERDAWEGNPRPSTA